MKKILLFALMLTVSFIFISNLYASDIKIVDIKGKVLLRENPKSRWQTAKIGATLAKDYQILTKRRAECTLSLKKGYEQILTIKENTQVSIQDLITNTIKLDKGRVFALIKKIGKGESFKVKTPTAIAGVRGTGLAVFFDRDITTTLCFEGRVAIEGLDTQGNVVSQDEVWQGFGIEVEEGGNISEFIPIEEENKNEWKEFRDEVEEVIETDPLRNMSYSEEW